MTDETKRIFNAPFAVMGDSTDYTKFNVIIHDRKSPRYCSTVASCIDQKTAIRFTRLPELYDKLMWAAVQYCPDAFLTLDECRLCTDKKCKYREIIELLRKVRNGE